LSTLTEKGRKGEGSTRFVERGKEKGSLGEKLRDILSGVVKTLKERGVKLRNLSEARMKGAGRT